MPEDHREYLRLMGEMATMLRICDQDDIEKLTEQQVEVTYQRVKEIEAGLEVAGGGTT